jgi:hypothetical protein
MTLQAIQGMEAADGMVSRISFWLFHNTLNQAGLAPKQKSAHS